MIDLRLGDCLEKMKQIPDGSIDLVVTDCPYKIVSGGCSNDAVKIGRYAQVSGVFAKRLDQTADAAAIADTKAGKLFAHNDIQFREWLPEVYRVLRPGTHCYVMISPRNLKELWTAAEDAGFAFQNLIVWDKGTATPNRWYMQCYELILMLRKGPARKINNKGTKNMLRIPNIVRTKKHPTEKPVELMRVLVENSTAPGETVLDPFMGVGGVGIACKNTGRNFIGMEIDENYFRIAEERMKE